MYRNSVKYRRIFNIPLLAFSAVNLQHSNPEDAIMNQSFIPPTVVAILT